MKVNKNDFVEIEYTGRLKEDNSVFDTTLESAAKDTEFYDEKKTYKPVVLCVGQRQILDSVDKSLIGREVGENFKIELKAEDAFGKKDSNLMQFIPTTNFTQHNIRPVPGLHVNIDGMMGIVRVASGGRTVVDFNHPLAGKDVVYEVSVKRKVEDKEEKLKALLSNMLTFEPKIDFNGNEAVVALPVNIKPEEDELKKLVKEVIPEITTLQFNQIKKE